MTHKRKGGAATYRTIKGTHAGEEGFMNSRGVFITLMAFFMAIMLVASASNIQKMRVVGNAAGNSALAGERAFFLKQNMLDSARDVYKTVGHMEWGVSGNTFVYHEMFPEPTNKNRISATLSSIKAFAYQEFTNSVSLNPAGADLGRIRVYNKDFNVIHAAGGGFGSNSDINFNKGFTNFSTVLFEVATQDNINQVVDALPLCGACANPVRMIIRVSDLGGAKYSFDNNVDFLQPGSLNLKTQAGLNVILNYGPTGMNWSSAGPLVTLDANITFKDSAFDVGLDRNIAVLAKMGGFGFSD